jgi:outer membrane protein assembly factor BamA
VDVSHRNWGTEWSFNPWLDFNPDDGLFIGGGPVYTKYGYRMEPYAEQIGVRAGVATKTGRYRLDASGEFRDWYRSVRAFIQLHASQLDLSNFFGLGNETQYSQSLDDANFYKVDQRQIFLHAALGLSIATNTSAAIGSTIKLIDNNPKPGTLLDTMQLSYYNKSLTFINLAAQIQVDSRDAIKLPTRGIYMKTEFSYLPKMFDNASTFYKFKGELRTYYTIHDFQSITVAFRAAGEKIWGDHPFFESAFLGGNECIFVRQRRTPCTCGTDSISRSALGWCISICRNRPCISRR